MMSVRKGGLICAVLGVALLPAACSSPPTRSPSQVTADNATAARVYAALNDDPVYFFAHIDVTVDNGVARLSGFVWTADAQYEAQRVARGVPGVVAVADELELARASKRGGSG